LRGVLRSEGLTEQRRLSLGQVSLEDRGQTWDELKKKPKG
jgi:hypothetical protein